MAATRSHDSQTQHGCVITDAQHRILGMGYNGFPRGMPDDLLPDTRPEKYPWMIHSERNALDNCIIKPQGGIAYITGKPCLKCFQALHNNGIRLLVCADRRGWNLDDEEKEAWDWFHTWSGIKIQWVTPNLSHIKEMLDGLYNNCPNQECKG